MLSRCLPWGDAATLDTRRPRVCFQVNLCCPSHLSFKMIGWHCCLSLTSSAVVIFHLSSVSFLVRWCKRKCVRYRELFFLLPSEGGWSTEFFWWGCPWPLTGPWCKDSPEKTDFTAFQLKCQRIWETSLSCLTDLWLVTFPDTRMWLVDLVDSWKRLQAANILQTLCSSLLVLSGHFSVCHCLAFRMRWVANTGRWKEEWLNLGTGAKWWKAWDAVYHTLVILSF